MSTLTQKKEYTKYVMQKIQANRNQRPTSPGMNIGEVRFVKEIPQNLIKPNAI